MSAAGRRISPATQTALEAARHICQEARVVLTSLRAGPPAVARGELAQDLMDLRFVVKDHLDTTYLSTKVGRDDAPGPSAITSKSDEDNSVIPSKAAVTPPLEDDEEAVLVERPYTQGSSLPHESPMPKSRICNFSPGAPQVKEFGHGPTRSLLLSPEHVGPYARPFLAVVMDPRAAGPHTLLALRALFRLLERGSLVEPSSHKHEYHVALEPLMKGVLACKFEQTDAGADEAVEMAIADLLALLVALSQKAFLPHTLMDAFNTVFVTRNTFVHSPALCYHFEDVLASMVVSVFENVTTGASEEAARLILEFLVNQLLHTPLMGGEALDDAAREAQVAHDATRVLCLRLSRCCLRSGWGNAADGDVVVDSAPLIPDLEDCPAGQPRGDAVPTAALIIERPLLRIIQDDLCLSLLMTGQAIWAYHDSTTNISPGFISLEVLSEICATLSTLWNTVSLRRHLGEQFEKIFTGFYQRALVLLRKRANADDPISFNANLAFDAEVEIILESLVDLLCLHESAPSTPSKRKSAIEALFATYDCSLSHADVAGALMVELCRCCGGIIDDDGEVVLGRPVPSRETAPDDSLSVTAPTVSRQSSRASLGRSESAPMASLREVPAHLKELCAEALSGSMKCLFHGDSPEEENHNRPSGALRTVHERIPLSPRGDVQDDRPRDLDSPYQEERLRAQFAGGSVSLRYIKSQKQLLRRAAKLFNKKSSKGIEFLMTSRLIPDPVTPVSVAGFLRNALVVGLDKAAVGAYLGEIGKAPAAGKSPPIWARDWFHKEVLESYCTMFRFEGQSLLDGLRMFLAAFRLPGEGQQIDRIIQAFAESCGRICDESARLKLFSDDPKRASDPAFLLAYSIIMLNTDLHNSNIREDRKMSLEAFIRNNTDYGRDITERGKELPRKFLTGIYEAIRDEEIRTEGEGAEGHMTVERWKDVLRGSTGDADPSAIALPNERDDPDLKEVVLETLWQPVLSAIGAFWDVVKSDEHWSDAASIESSHNMMLGAQGARLGMDMAIDLLEGARNMNRIDVFRQVFSQVCQYTGLLESQLNAVDQTWAFVNSVEAQSAVVVAIKMAREAGNDIGREGWKNVWGMIFELRDLKLLGGGVKRKQTSMLMESDPDLLTAGGRREWNMWLVKGDVDSEAEIAQNKKKASSSLFGALFGSTEPSVGNSLSNRAETELKQGRGGMLGKGESVIWDELAPSDDEDHGVIDDNVDHGPTGSENSFVLTAGTAFENQLIQEDIILQLQADTNIPVTGLERAEDTRRYRLSPRARVRKRLLLACDFAGLVADSRFMDKDGFESLLSALVGIVAHCTNGRSSLTAADAVSDVADDSNADGAVGSSPVTLLSPASEAFAEVLIAETSIKNRDRLETTWQSILKEHYTSRLQCYGESNAFDGASRKFPNPATPGIEKCATGLLRVCSCAVSRETMANDIVCALSLLYPSESSAGSNHLADLDRHLSEGLWRISRNVDGLQNLTSNGWDSLLGLIEWCASVGDRSMPVIVDRDGTSAGLAEENPALQAYRSLHVILHAPELQHAVPFGAIRSIRALVATGERTNFPKLSVAGLDMILVLNNRVESDDDVTNPVDDSFWKSSWMPLLEGMAEAAKYSQYSGVRQHAISMLTDSFIDKQGRLIPPYHFCQAMPLVCIPLAGERIAEMLRDEIAMVENVEEVMIEFELCISLLFKPLLHHLKSILVLEADFLVVWKALLKVLEDLLVDGPADDAVSERGISPANLRHTTKQLATEHLRNTVMVLLASGVLGAAPEAPTGDISTLTWDSIAKMTFCKDQAEEWKQSAIMNL